MQDKLQGTAAILAGGKSERLGYNKAFITIDGVSIIERTAAKLTKSFSELIIVANDNEYQSLGYPVVPDIIANKGPLSGIHAALSAAAYPYCFVTACDMPYIDEHLAYFLLQQVPGYQAVVPQLDQYLQPLYAVYTKDCLPTIEWCLANSIRKVAKLYDYIKVNYIPKHQLATIADVNKVFININTPQQLGTLKREH